MLFQTLMNHMETACYLCLHQQTPVDVIAANIVYIMLYWTSYSRKMASDDHSAN